MSAESTVPYFFCRLCPPPSWMLPPLMMPRPPMSKFSSMMITEAPVSRAAHAHASPETPAPTTTTSADRSHLMLAASASFGCSPAAATAIPAVPFATVVLRKLLRLTGFGPFRLLLMAFSLMVMTWPDWPQGFCANTIAFAVSGTSS